MIASLKMQMPGFLAEWEWLTFGRVRPVHLATVIYGWGSMAGVGTLLWLQARLSRTRLPFPRLLPITALVWNVAVAYGSISILAGYGTSVEWLEFPAEHAGLSRFLCCRHHPGLVEDVHFSPRGAHLRLPVVPVRSGALVPVPLLARQS